MAGRKADASLDEQRRESAAVPTNLTRQTLSGVQWTYFGTGISALLQLGAAAVLGRLLEPAAFGLVAMALLALQFSNYFARMGVGPALIQKRELSNEEIRAGFTASIGLGALVAAVIWVAAPLAGDAFTEPDVVPILRAMGLTLVLHGAGLTAESLLRRHLRFRETATLKVLSYGVGYFAVGSGLALAGFGVWSLVIANLVQVGMLSALSYSRERHTLKPIFTWSAYRDLYGFGSRVSVISVLEYLGANLDTFAVGRYATAALLGQYSRAFVLVEMPLRQLNSALSSVLLPGLSRIQQDPPRLRRAFLGPISAAAAVLLPISAGMAVAAREIVLVVLGSQWEPIVAILPLITLASSFSVLSHYAGIVTEAQGELNKKLVLQGGYVVVLALLLLPAIGRELWAYAAAFAVAKMLQHIAYVIMLRTTLGIVTTDYARIYGRAALAAAATAAIIALGRQAPLALGAPLVVVLVVDVLLGAVALMLLLRFGSLRPLARELRERLAHAGVSSSSLTGRVALIVLGAR